MLRATGPGPVGHSSSISLLEWYILENELILVLERPDHSQDLHKYRHSKGGCLPEHEAKVFSSSERQLRLTVQQCLRNCSEDY